MPSWESFTSPFYSRPGGLNYYNLILLTKVPTCFLKSYGAGVDSFWDIKKEGVDIFEIVFIGAGSATMYILYVGVMPGDDRQEA